ncbi:MAG: carboxypeptidase regulatory-like domain-containing protein, partial [Thermoguttaceae bacterium]
AFRSAKVANPAAPLSRSERRLSADPLPQQSSASPADVSATAADPRSAAAPTAKPSIGSGRSLLAKSHCALILVWALGTVLYLLAMVRWLWLERRLAKSAGELDDASWQTLLEELKLQFGIRWAVALGVSQESEVPLTIGWRRPTIVLPVDCRCWMAGKRRVVLAHELSHVARHDVFWQIVARLACAVHWFHPLAWLAERRMRVERELACDDAVLRSGSQPGQYATVLLDVAAAIRRRPHTSAAAIAMTCRHPIQRRIRAILQPGLNRLPVSPRMGRLLLVAALLLVVLAAGLHPFAPPQVKADPAKSTVGTHLAPRDAVSEVKREKPGVRSLRIRVVDQAGKPIAGAKVGLGGVIRESQVRFHLEAVKTDGKGVATIEFPRQAASYLIASVTADKYVNAGAQWENNEKDGVRVPGEFTFTLEPGTTLGGTVRDEQGRPIGGAEVGILGQENLPGGIRFNQAVDNLLTDAEGRWTSHRMPKDFGRYDFAQIGLKHPVYASPPAFDLKSQQLDQLRAGAAVTVMQKGAVIEGVVTDPQGKPVAGATVGLFLHFFRQLYLRAETDEKGRYRLPACEAGEYAIAAAAKSYAPDSQRVAVAKDPRKVDLRLRKGELIRIRVVDKQGRPLQGATVSPLSDIKYPAAMALHFQIAGERGQFQVTSEDGRWSTLWIPGDRLHFFVSNNVKSVDVRVPPGAPERVVVLEAGGYARLGQAAPLAAANAANAKVSGKVIDENGKPLPGAEIWLPLFLRGLGRPQTLHTKSDEQGRFVLEIDAAWLAKMQPWERAMTLWAYASGRQLGTGKVVLPSGASDVVIRLGPAADTSFVVLNPEGRPCAGALVELYYVRTALGFQFLPEELMARIAARTDSEGRVKLPAASQDILFEVRITAKDLGIQVQRVEKSKPPAIVGRTIRLRPVGKIEGRVIADPPETARDVRFVFTTEDLGNNPPWPTEGNADVKSDKDGRFVVPALAAGVLMIEVLVNENQPLRPKLPEFVRFRAAETISLEIPMVPTVPVRGSVRAKDTGKPIPGGLVHIYYGVGRQGADAVPDAQGNYTARVLPGRIGLQMLSTPREYVQLGEVGNRPIEVPQDAKVFDLPPVELVPAKIVEGRLVDEHDRPVSDAGIDVIEGNRRYGYCKSDSSGKFSLDGVPTTTSLTNAEYEWFTPGAGVPHKCEVLKTNPLILRALPKDP